MEYHELWAGDARVLADIGLALTSRDLPPVEVRLPGALAELAVGAWERDDSESGSTAGETIEQRQVRHRAAALALIGLAVNELGWRDGGDVVVELSPDLIGDAFRAADEMPAVGGEDANSEDVV
jgi:hypothetical protein